MGQDLVDVDLIANAVVSLLTAAIYGYVGLLMWRRELPPGPRLASRLFGVWWASFGILYLLVAAVLSLAIATAPNLAIAITLLYVLVIALSVGLWGLLYYLTYVYTGNARWIWPLSIFYGLVAFSLIYLVTWMEPTSVGFGAFGLDIDYKNRLTGAPATAVGLAISLPVLVAAVLYASLFARAEGRTERFRIALVSGSFIVWFGWSVASNLLRLSERFPGSPTLTVIGRFIGLAAPLLVLLAYRPPAPLRRRYGLRAVDETSE